ncbi:MAG: AbrB/MazE/SpoVT family DNA-binding domain-containing protein [Chloroflexi bacterium]|nr:AbrB/MazE/SpoVT family DNA-binding domain-containing protein [Chloroflexota bacterium]
MNRASGMVRRVQARGQVTIPELIRQRCGIDAGSDLLFVQTGPDTFECQRILAGGSLLDFLNAVSGGGMSPELDTLRQGMAADLEADERG